MFVGFTGNVPAPTDANGTATMAAQTAGEEANATVQASTADSESQASEARFTKEDALWLARVIYSETKRPEEQELVAWVVRNRVETGYRGKRSIKDTVLDPYQFSAFNPQSRARKRYENLTPQHASSNWQRALAIAYGVRGAPDSLRPFPRKTRHFYSERSMVGRRHPDWARGMKPVAPERTFALDERRFRFFEGVY